MAYKKQKKIVSLRRKCMKSYLQNLTGKSLTNSKIFWKFMKLFLTNKGFIGNNGITLIHKNKIISDEKQLTKLFNNYYISIVGKSRGTKPKTFSTNFENTNVQPVSGIVSSYKHNPIILIIKQVVNGSHVSDSERISFKTVIKTVIKDLLRNLDIKKMSGMDTIPPKFVKLLANFLTPLLTKAINTSITQNIFPENAKLLSLLPFNKGKPNNNKPSYFSPVVVLNTFSKVIGERVLRDKIVCRMEKYISSFLSAYRKNYNKTKQRLKISILSRLVYNPKKQDNS